MQNLNTNKKTKILKKMQIIKIAKISKKKKSKNEQLNIKRFIQLNIIHK